MHRDDAVPVTLRGRALLRDPVLNKGTAFSTAERRELGLTGLLPKAVETLGTQVRRVRVEYDTKTTDIGRHIFLRQLADANQVLFYRFVLEYLEEVLPVVYTPTVGQVCRQYSQIYRRPHGLFVGYPDIDRIDEMLGNGAPEQLRIVVVTDGERILGLGDQGAGGMGIPIGKLDLYTACGGIDPATTLPVMLDAGTNNEALLSDPLYLGWRHERIVGDDYDRFVDAFVEALRRRWPRVLLQWEDFAQHHAGTLLDRYRGRLCSFNDDIQGTAAMVVAVMLAGARHSGTRVADQRVVIAGAGSAGCGIGSALVKAMVASGASPDGARQAVFVVDRGGLLHDGMDGLTSFQAPLAQPATAVAGWASSPGGGITLLDTVARVQPTVLIGTSGQPGLFSEGVVGTMAAAVARPVVLPLSNPTERSEAVAADVHRWSGGRALVATGSPFPGVPQANNVYVFPGLGLGALAVEASSITDGMLGAAAGAVAAAAPAGELLPPLAAIRSLSREVAVAVGLAGVADGVAPVLDARAIEARVDELVWEPRYRALAPS